MSQSGKRQMTGKGSEKAPAEPTFSELKLRLEPALSKGETPDEAAMTLLWSQVGSDFDRGIQCVADEIKVSEESLLNLLADNAAAEAEAHRVPSQKISWRWVKGHWPEFTFATLVVLVVFLILRASGALAFVSPVLGVSRPVVVRTVSKLPAYRVIRPEDVKQEEAEASPETGAFDSAEKVVGLYTLQPLAAGTVLREPQLSSARLESGDMAGRQLLSLPVKAGMLAASVTPAERVSLLFAPQGSEGHAPAHFILEDVIVLSVDRGSTFPSIVAAAPASANMTELVQRLGTSDVYVMYTVP
jgi:hypothetical protein